MSANSMISGVIGKVTTLQGQTPGAIVSVAVNGYDFQKREKVTDWFGVFVYGKTYESNQKMLQTGNNIVALCKMTKYTDTKGEHTKHTALQLSYPFKGKKETDKTESYDEDVPF